jgi:hypothetical protein
MPDKRTWSALLTAYTQRNAGRRVEMEIDDPEFGAQRQGAAFPLLGISYDPRDERVAIMFGNQGSTAARLTHSIASVSGIEVADNGSRPGEVLRVQHGEAQTLLRLV